jgi:hypothetical protein
VRQRSNGVHARVLAPPGLGGCCGGGGKARAAAGGGSCAGLRLTGVLVGSGSEAAPRPAPPKPRPRPRPPNAGSGSSAAAACAAGLRKSRSVGADTYSTTISSSSCDARVAAVKFVPEELEKLSNEIVSFRELLRRGQRCGWAGEAPGRQQAARRSGGGERGALVSTLHSGHWIRGQARQGQGRQPTATVAGSARSGRQLRGGSPWLPLRA